MTTFGILIVILGIGCIGIGWFIIDDARDESQEIQERLDRYCK